MRVTVIHNPSAGAGRHDRDDLLHAIHRAGHDTVYVSTKEDEWRAVLERPADLVVAAGGDGTVDKVGVALAGRGVPLAIVPLGTANNIARSLGLSLELEALIAAWRNARRRPFDVGLVHGIPKKTRFLEAVGVGLFPDTMSATTSESRPTAMPPDEALDRDLVRIVDRLASQEPRPWRVSLDGRDLSGEYLLLEAMNIGSIGPDLNLTAHTDPGDGLLDVVTVSAAERDELADYLLRRRTGDPRPPSLAVSRGRKLVFYGSGSDLHVDGSLIEEYITPTRFFTVHVGLWPQALELLV